MFVKGVEDSETSKQQVSISNFWKYLHTTVFCFHISAINDIVLTSLST